MIKKTLLLLFLGIFALLCSCQNKKDKLNEASSYWVKFISCDFEDYSKTSDTLIFSTDSSKFLIKVNGAINQNYCRSKNNSLEIANNYNTPILNLNDLKKGQLIEITIWQRSIDTGAVVSVHNKYYNSDNNDSFESTFSDIVKSKKGWKQHFLSIPITDSLKTFNLRIGTKDSISIFDDLKIRIYPVIPENKIAKSISLYIPNKSKNKLNRYIDKALNKRVIPTSSKKYVKAYYLNNGDSIKIEMKIKGDWTDHVKPNKASYRLKLGSDNAFEGMNSFSIQHPKTRNYLSEWIMHEIAEHDDVLTTHYDFINVIINDYFYGVYALEEHFDKHILENRARREGPILKSNETGVWQYHKAVHDKGFSKEAPFFEASHIDAFKLNRILKNLTLHKQYLEGQKLVQLFINGHLKIDDVFDIDQLAKYYVLVELSSNYHALTWHNRRYYFNPVTQKLENIFFDAIPYFTNDESIIKKILMNTEKEPNLILDNALFMNRTFKEKYLFHLNKKLNAEFIDSIYLALDKKLPTYLSAIKGESMDYSFVKNSLNHRIKFLKSNLEEIAEIWDHKIEEAQNIEYWMKEQKYEAYSEAILFDEIAVNAYTHKTSDNKSVILLENYHLNPVEIHSISYRKKGQKHEIAKKLQLKAFKYTADNTNITVDSIPYKIYYTASNTGSKVHSTKVLPWKKPSGLTTRMKLSEKFNPNSHLYKVLNDTLTLNKTAKINELIFIPKNYKVQVLAGSKIEFGETGGIIVNNEFICKGHINNPIKITSTASNSSGITILNAEKATIHYTEVSGLSNLSFENWILTGAITIYETETDINNLTIRDNKSEDALNIIRSHFKIRHLKISETKSDGFDADFCSGTIDSSIFKNTGNDCIDFSGSKISLSNIDIYRSGDKGISGGEGSTLKLFNIYIDGALTGIASKDASLVSGNKIIIKNVNSGSAAFQKKSNYGSAEIKLDNVELINCTSKVSVELGSKITLNGVYYTGTKKFNIDELYEAFSK